METERPIGCFTWLAGVKTSVSKRFARLRDAILHRNKKEDGPKKPKKLKGSKKKAAKKAEKKAAKEAAALEEQLGKEVEALITMIINKVVFEMIAESEALNEPGDGQ